MFELRTTCYLTLIVTALTGPLMAQGMQFSYEKRDTDGEVVAILSEADDGFEIGFFDNDLMQVASDRWMARWSGRFESEVSPSNLGMVRDNTFVRFDHPTRGEISCRPSDDDNPPNSWTRSINRDVLKAGFLNFRLATCMDASGQEVAVPALPFTVSATYALEKL